MLGSVPDTLVQYGLGGGAVELVAGAVIEIGKRWIEKKYHIGGGKDDDTDISGADDSPCDSEQPADPSDQDPAG